jgi:hypothetical protein
MRRPLLRAECLAVASLLGLLLGSCASVRFDRDTPSSGTFKSTAWAVTFLTSDLPNPAMEMARANVSDARQPNIVVSEASVYPNLWIFDWVFEFIGVRYAVLEGTWGFPPQGATDEPSN